LKRNRDGRIGATKHPQGAAAAWWVEADEAGAVLRVARQDSGYVVAVARALGVALVEHDAVVERATAAA
jgi:hypothetical protein